MSKKLEELREHIKENFLEIEMEAVDDCTEEIFLKGVSEHELTIIQDDGVHRHLMCRRPKDHEHSYTYWYGIVTWPGYLIIYGDMGEYCFSRTNDMFCFFRYYEEDKLRINRSYWAEKLQSTDVRSGHSDFCYKTYLNTVGERLMQYVDDYEEELVEDEMCGILLEEIRDHFTWVEDERSAYEQALTFYFQGREVLDDFWEHRLKDYNYHFVWCLYAIVWAIREYDKVKGIERK